ncbi:alpha/beta fold hydrolase [Actinokineospora guangxiensis]|uniref:Alpha/beta fold hydrolase n=1 Tax=Actinokineospora guangxiensis TaxID=1490288 RepID=A0ABW0EL81_9PSEU
MTGYRHHPARDEPRHRMLLLHGLGNSASLWDDYAARKADDVEAWALDLPWRGDGDPSWGHPSDLAAAVREVVAGAPERPDVLVAHSFAASLVLDVLCRADGAAFLRERGVRGVVLVSPFYRRDPADFTWEAVAGMPAGFRALIVTAIRLRSRGRIGSALESDMAARVCERVGAYGWSRFLEVYLNSPWLRVDLAEVPALVIAGAADAARTDAGHLAADLPAAELVELAGCAHFPMLERPAEFAAALDRFPADLRSADRCLPSPEPK